MPPPSKRRKTDSATAEILFDPASRSDYLTGFHKRKQARIKAAQEKAAARDRLQKIKDRAEAKQRRKEELEAHVEAVNLAVKALNGRNDSSAEEDNDEEEDDDGESEWIGFPAAPIPKIDREDEYTDEEKYTTVTVSEVGISRTGFVDPDSEDDETPQEQAVSGERNGSTKSVKKDTKDKKRKKKKRSFRYETKEERKITKQKERRKNSIQAQIRRSQK